MKILLVGSYDMVYTGKTNTLNRRSIPDIALRESNEDKEQLFMSLCTRKDIHRNDEVELTIDNEFYNRVDELSKIEKQTTFDQYPMF